MLAMIVAIGALVGPPSAEIPRELLRACAAREELASGQVIWTRTDDRRRPDREFSFVSRYAKNGDIIHEARGDQDGWVEVDGAGVGLSKFPELRMLNDEGLWLYRETSPVCAYWRHDGELGPDESNPPPTQADLKDIRWIGTSESFEASFAQQVAAISAPGEAGAERVWSSEAIEEGRIRVSATASGEQRSWVIDPAKGWSVESTRHSTPARTVETISQLANHGGTWFPERVSRYVDGELVETIAILSAEFNHATDRPSFTPEDIGVEIGVNISPQNFRVDGAMLFWTGHELVDVREYRRARRAGEIQSGPLMRHIRDHGPEGSPYLTDRERSEYAELRRARGFEFKPTHSDWERYVRDYIARYRLNDEQSQRGLAILRDCQTRARSHIQRAEAEREAAQGRAHAPGGAAGVAASGPAVDATEALRAQLNLIFDEQLKPRLDRIPTSAQRRAVEAQRSATTQPASQRSSTIPAGPSSAAFRPAGDAVRALP